MINKLEREGGPAFPHEYTCAWAGLTTRDYFAAKAMQALLISCPPPDYDMDNQDYASDAYAHADAMLKERDK